MTFVERLRAEHEEWERRQRRWLRVQQAGVFIAAAVLTFGWVEFLLAVSR